MRIDVYSDKDLRGLGYANDDVLLSDEASNLQVFSLIQRIV